MNFIQNPLVRRIGIVAVILLAFLLGLALRGGSPGSTDPSEHGAAESENTVWTCSMHPQIQMPNSGQCPICGMDLIPLKSSSGGDEGPRTLTLSSAAQKIAEIQTTVVVRQSVEKSLRMVGKLEADETRVREIAAWVPGRIDRLYVDYTGVPVRNGEKLFDLYSPELYSAQEELIQAIKASDQLSKSTMESTRLSAARTIEAVKERLRLWGLTDKQIEEVEKRHTPSDHVTIVAPMNGVVLHKGAVEGAYVQTGSQVYEIADLSVLWLKLDVYESDLAWMKLGLSVDFETDTYPGERFQGVVAFIHPMLNERSRSVKVRVNVENPNGRLKPGMFARAVVRAPVEGENQELPLIIPASAPLVTGTRAVVYVQDNDQPGQFQGREIVLGPRAGDFFVVLEGLSEGERVVSNGSFKIDSALQILAKKSMMNPEGGGPAPVHQHGSAAPETMAEEPKEVQAVAGVPEKFRLQLDDVLAVYFEISTALSQDSLDKAKGSAEKLPQALSDVDQGILPHTGHSIWVGAKKELEKASDSIAKSSDIKTARRAFFELSVQLLQTVRAFGASGQTPVLVYHCPMARDGAGADWLQKTVGTENPYYGSQMFKCGSQTEALAGSPSGDASADHINH
jgi:Cu(I)/Ag(I) efflux system membrane fusion protein